MAPLSALSSNSLAISILVSSSCSFFSCSDDSHQDNLEMHQIRGLLEEQQVGNEGIMLAFTHFTHVKLHFLAGEVDGGVTANAKWSFGKKRCLKALFGI